MNSDLYWPVSLCNIIYPNSFTAWIMSMLNTSLNIASIFLSINSNLWRMAYFWRPLSSTIWVMNCLLSQYSSFNLEIFVSLVLEKAVLRIHPLNYASICSLVSPFFLMKNWFLHLCHLFLDLKRESSMEIIGFLLGILLGSSYISR